MTTAGCAQCGASLVFEGTRTQTCPYCASPNFVDRAPSADQPTPRFVVAFADGDQLAKRAYADWLGGRSVFADSALRQARVEDLRAVYVPAYLYSAVARSNYTASIGEHYTETETYTERNSDGTESTKTRTVTRTEHRALAGSHLGYATDVIVTASAGLPNAELEAVEPFDLRQLRRFEPAVVAGWPTEEFSRTGDDCIAMARGEAAAAIGRQLDDFMPGDSHSGLAYQTTVSWESLEPLLLPIWVLAVRYRDDRPPLRLVVNGQTGRATGRAPLSWWKITLTILIAAALIAGVALWAHRHPP